MAYSLVGSAGAVTLGAADAAVTPAWDAGASRTTGNLLVCLLAGWGNGSVPTTPTGWSTVAAGSPTLAIFYMLAAGSDTAPTVAAITGMTWAAQLLEFSGNVASAPLDKHNTGVSGSTSPLALATSGADAATGDLVVWTVAEGSFTITATMASSPNNGMAASDVTNNSTSTAHHYLLGWGITTGNSVADSNSVTFDDAASDTVIGMIASFKAIPPPRQSNLHAAMRARLY